MPWHGQPVRLHTAPDAVVQVVLRLPPASKGTQKPAILGEPTDVFGRGLCKN